MAQGSVLWVNGDRVDWMGRGGLQAIDGMTKPKQGGMTMVETHTERYELYLVRPTVSHKI